MKKSFDLSDFIKIIISAAVPLIFSAAVTFLVSILTIESVIINVSSSVQIDDQYFTVVDIHNLKDKTLSFLSLYVDDSIYKGS